MILSIELLLAMEIMRVWGWAECVLEDTRYQITIPYYTDTQVSGLRSIERQKRYTANGRSKWYGNPKNSSHVLGRAIHLGLRYRKSGRFIPYSPAGGEPARVFELVVSRMEKLGWKWGGRWRSLRDYQHFEKREG